MTRRLALIAAVTAAVLSAGAGCDALPADEAAALPVVSAMLEAGAAPPAVYVTRVAPLAATAGPEARAIPDAEVTLRHLASGRVFTYRSSPAEPRRHDAYPVDPADPSARIVAGDTYRLTVVVPSATGADTLRAETTVPLPIQVAERPADGAAYGDGAGPAFRLASAGGPARRTVYVFKVSADKPDGFERVTVGSATRWRTMGLPDRYPLTDGGRLLNDCDRDTQGRDVCRWVRPASISTPQNEAGYERLADGTVRVRIPWFEFRFFGPQGVTVYSLDDALAHFLSSLALQDHPSTLSPGEIPNAAGNVENGLGVVGSFARAESRTFVGAEAGHVP